MLIMIKTKRLVLQPFRLNIIESGSSNYLQWFLDQEITKFNSHGLFPQSIQETTDFFAELEKPNKNELIFAMIADPESNASVHIGNVSLQRIDWINRSAEFAIIIGEKEYWGQGYACEALHALFDHGFNKLNLNRIWSGTAATNIGMQKVIKRLYMKKEGTYKQGMFLEGKYVDVYSYAVLVKEWKRQEKAK